MFRLVAAWRSLGGKSVRILNTDPASPSEINAVGEGQFLAKPAA